MNKTSICMTEPIDRQISYKLSENLENNNNNNRKILRAHRECDWILT